MRKIYVSDWHLGSKHSDTSKINEFIQNIEFDELYLVGDIIDGWKIEKKKFHWDKHCEQILYKILKLAKSKKIVYVIGNHDEFLKNIKKQTGHIHFCEEYIDDKTYIIHGDKFDTSIDKFGKFGDKVYDVIDDLGHKIGVNLKNYFKKYCKSIVNHLLAYENLIYYTALEKKCYNVVTGHVHDPKLELKEKGYYANCGRWIKLEPCTYIIQEKSMFKLSFF